MSVIPATIVAPNRRGAFIERDGLRNLTSDVAAARMTLISAPAGSGKTTAASYWFDQITASGRPGLWLACRAGIRDLETFRRALKEAGLRAGLPWTHLDPASTIGSWLVELASYGKHRPVIVIDDAHYLSQDVLEFVAQWIVGARDAITMIMASRGDTPIPVSRMRSLGFLVEVGMVDLNFSESEAGDLFARIAGSSCNPACASDPIHEMGGWASGLVMAAEQARKEAVGENQPSSLFEHLVAYFDEEVLNLQDAQIRDFLIETSVLEKLTPSACAAVMSDSEAGAILEQVHRDGLFVSKLPDERNAFAYHPLFRDLIYEAAVNRGPARIAEAHRRASEHFALEGDAAAAIFHAQRSDDQHFLADQLDRLANAMIYRGDLYFIDEVGSGLPWEVMRTRPMLLLALAWRRTRRLSLTMAERYINAAEEIAASRPDDHELSYILRHRRLLLEAARDNLRVVKMDAESLLVELGDEEPYLSCTLLGLLMSARKELFHFQDILKLEAETKRALARPGSEFAAIALKSMVAPTLVVQGKTPVARSYLQEALDYAEARLGIGSSVAAVPALPLAELLYDADELDRASDLLDRYLPVIRQWGMVDEVAAGFITRARLTFARGNVAQALAGLEEAHLIAIECGLERLRALIVAEQVRILVRTGQVAAAEEAMRAGDIFVDEPPVPTMTPTRRQENIAVAWLRIEIQRQRLSGARKVATRWLEFVKRNAAKRSIVVFQLLLAEIAVLEGQRSKAQRAIREAIEIAEPAGWVRPFLDEGDVICSLLAEAYVGGSMVDTPADVFASRIVAVIDGVPEDFSDDEDDLFSLSTSALVDREVEILTMVQGGLRNREIGERLGLTEGTVKWYLQQVYDKLGVRRRSQAVIKARQCGLIS